MEKSTKPLRSEFPVQKWPLGWALAVNLILTVGIGWIDYTTGYEISLAVFYLIPTTLAVFVSGRTLGIVFSVLCTASWLVANLLSGAQYTSPFAVYWNTLIRLAYFLFQTLLFSSLLKTLSVVRQLSFYDPLTGAANRRYFEEVGNRMIKAAQRNRTAIALAYLDVDHFKRVNDTRGHGTGDKLLVSVASTIEGEIRPTDMVARLGGDEFAIFLAGTSQDEATEILERIRANLGAAMDAHGWKVTFSIGAIVVTKPPQTMGPLMERVDQLMYDVKRNGRNNLRLENLKEDEEAQELLIE